MRHDYIEHGVRVTEVAEASKRTVEETVNEARVLSIFIGTDWRGEPAVEERDAAQLVDGSARQQQAAEAAWRAHLAQTERWESERRRVYLAAHEAAVKAHDGEPLPMLLPGVPLNTKGPREIGRDAQAAGDRAVLIWERSNPAPHWQGQPTASLWRRVADAVAGAVR